MRTKPVIPYTVRLLTVMVFIAGCSGGGDSDSGTATTTTSTGTTASTTTTGTTTSTTTTTATASTKYTMRFTDTVGRCFYDCPPGVSLGDRLTIDVVVDNGKSKKSNTWDYKHAKKVTYRAGTWSATINPRLGTPTYYTGSFKTNASGALTAIPSAFHAGQPGDRWGQSDDDIGFGQPDSNGNGIWNWSLNYGNDILFVYENGDQFLNTVEMDSIGTNLPGDGGFDDISKWSIR